MSGPRLEGIELVRLRLPLRAAWVTAAGRVTARDVLLVRAVVDGVDGWGECVAQTEPTYTSEYVEGAADVLARHLIPRVLAARLPLAAEVDGPARGPSPSSGWTGPTAAALAAVKGHPMAKAAIECAVLDATLRLAGRPLAAHLAAAADPPATELPATVPAGVAVGVAGDVDALMDEVAGYVADGYRRVKLKIHPGWDCRAVEAVRERWPARQLPLQVDANGSYALVADPAAALRPLEAAELLLIEQPLGDDDLLGHAALAAALRTPVCLDESITSPAAAATALSLGAAGVVNIKAGRVGGLAEAVQIHDRCRAAGVPVWCGGMLETGVGRAANLALAALPGFTLPGDLSAADRFWAEDIVTQPVRLRPDGTVAVPTAPGLGVELTSALDGVSVDRTWWPAS
ncbi:MAG TPA: o-succinylbenzoate synthase [Acidimicrobiales bacterium]|nr:o-succinylbenzoate synthase [Acidimicrobiales bacterium]